jgi:hypothetical protein
MQKRSTKIRRGFAGILAVGALAVAAPATSYADGGGSPPPAGQSGGGTGGP